MLFTNTGLNITAAITLSLLIISLSSKAELGIKNTYRLSQHHFSQAYPLTIDKISEDNSDTELSVITLTPGKKRNILSRALAEAADRSGNAENKLLSQYTVQDLNLLSGSTSAPEQSVLRNLGATITASGEVMLANALITPSSSIDILEQRQELIKYLVENPDLIGQLEGPLKKFATEENGIISLFNPSDTIYSGLFRKLDAAKHIGLILKSSQAMEAFRRTQDTLPLFFPLQISLYFLPVIYNNFKSTDSAVIGLFASAPPLAVLAIVEPLMIYVAKMTYKQTSAYYTYIMGRSLSPARALFSALELWKILEPHPEFKAAAPFYPEFSQLVTSTEVQEILKLLKDPPETTPAGLWGYYTTNMGRYKKALELFAKHKESLLPIIQATGDIDAWLTIAKLVRSGQLRESNPITFAHFEQQHSTPFLHLNQFWNPHLTPEVAVANDIMAGHSLPANTVITGPNAAGKSTNMDAIAIAALLAQTFGIVPAQYAKLTPFSLIHTHMDVSSEIAAGLSTFKAESVRAIELMDHIEKMDKQQFSLALMDEIFSSTNPIEGEAGTYGYLKTISNNQNAINICTTHYPRLSLLATEYPGIFQNMHVRAEVTDGKLVYDYRLKPGYSEQRIAIKILEEEGIQSEFLDIATDIIEHPERYPLENRDY